MIFVHELGHFLVAKACGVKCEKFIIGFDIGGYKLSRKWGETEYGIGILPLGGYVKMLGQDDDPGPHRRAAQEVAKSPQPAPTPSKSPAPTARRYFVDRRSYLAKSVPQRMAIISAGVIMNVIFAFIFAVDRLRHRREVHAVHRVGDGARLAGLAGRARAGRRNREDRRPRQSDVHCSSRAA